MDNVIGLKGTPQDRADNWVAMLAYRQGWARLKDNPETNSIAISDKKRYKKVLRNYVA
jgi:hypothetical protein